MDKDIIVLIEYLDFINIFLKKIIIELLKYFNINKYTINLESNKQLPYEPIYSLNLIEFKTFKTYIKTNLANSFIYLSKFLAKLLILFI